MKLMSSEFPKYLKEYLEDSKKEMRRSNCAAFNDAQFQEVARQLKQGELLVPDDTIQNVIRSTVERDFLNEPVPGESFTYKNPNMEQGWIRISRLPVSPLKDKEHALYPIWQNTIATLHTLNHRLCYVLQRKNGSTSLLLGAIPMNPGMKAKDVQNQLHQAVSGQMPGIGIEPISYKERQGMNTLRCCGAVTGIPSVRKMNEYGEYQTMDQIAVGLRDIKGQEKDFAVVVVADPISDDQIVQVLRSMENFGSEVHALTKYTKITGETVGATVSRADTGGTNTGVQIGVSGGVNAGVGLSLGKVINANVEYNLNHSKGRSEGIFSSLTDSRSASKNRSNSVSQEYINKSAMYCEELFDKHIARMKAGRSLGFWKTGVYVLAESKEDVQTVMGMLRAVYSGDDTYIEPIRTSLMPGGSGADMVVRSFQHLRYAYPPVAEAFGSLYEDYATPMTTEELSIATSLPHRDVPGLRLIRNASRFALNPPIVRSKEEKGHPVRLGDVLDIGVKTHQKYNIDLNQLVRHAFVGGTNGSGKSNTCKYLLNKMLEENIPFLVIEPAKDEYLDWAINRNKISGKKKIKVFAPGLFGNNQISQLRLNPFQPATIKGEWVNMLGHLDRFKSVLLSSMPMADVLPLIMEETIYRHVENNMNVKSFSGKENKMSPLDGPYKDDGKMDYPLVKGMDNTARAIVEGRRYAPEVESNISAAVSTRVKSMLLGWKKELFNVTRSTDFAELFENNNVVINLSHLTDDRDKAFVMSILLIALWEYRESKYNSDKEYKKKANADQLMHLTLIEEAHRLMPNVQEDFISGMNSQANTAKMFSNMLSEIRAYGEGCVVVDQVPTRLIPDAVKNTNLKIIHRLTSADDIHAISASMMLRPDQEAVVGMLQQGEAIVCSDFDDAAAWVKIDKVPK